ncbi:MAG: SUMF1/EgtB/PvdO family nonheme iron enzyme [Ardenticatenia bacterium]|nr:SUMF1/EgtB/PvdO family nonheme iron enzyme [Ardenticatenia bacterium]
MDTFSASFLAGLAAEVGGGLILEMGRSLKEKFGSEPQRAAIERSVHMGILAMLLPARGLEADLRDQLQTGLHRFFTTSEAALSVLDLLQGRSVDIASLAKSFRHEVYGAEELVGLRAETCLEAFELGFWRQAEAEEALANRITVGQSRVQTALLRQIVGVLKQLLDGQSAVAPQVGTLGLSADSITGTNVAGQQIIIQLGELRGASHLVDDHVLRRYLRRVYDEQLRVALLGIDRGTAANPEDEPVGLPDIYTALLTTSAIDGGRVGRKPDSNGRNDELADGIEGSLPLSSALNEANKHPRLVLLGEPGSGKSTFVKYLALALAGERLEETRSNLSTLARPLPWDKDDDDGQPVRIRRKGPPPPAQQWTHGPALPVMVILRDFVASSCFPAKAADCGADCLWSFVEQELAKSALGDCAVEIRKELLDKGGLVILDGLDEVPEAGKRRERLKKVIQDFGLSFSLCRIVVTSRTYAYQDARWRLDGYEAARLADFIPEQIDCFVHAWYDAVGPLRGLRPEEIKRQADDLSATIQARERLQELAVRPLLLTLMAGLHIWNRGRLPDGRQALYEDAVDLLLDRWEHRRVERDDAGNRRELEPSVTEYLGVGKDKIRAMLNELAYHAHAGQADLTGTADISEDQLAGALTRLDTRHGVRTKPLIDYLRYRTGILVERSDGVFTFPHRTFQEYLAACYLADHHFQDRLPELARSEPERWREALLLAGAKVAGASKGSVWELARHLSPKPPPSDGASIAIDDRWGAQLAGELLAESADLSAEISVANQVIRDGVIAWLREDLLGGSFPAIERAAAGRSLAILGDPRQEVLSTQKMAFCWVPSGPFLMGSDKSDDLGFDDERVDGKPHQVAMPQGYWMARFPVTQAQFSEFVADGGYGRASYWRVAEKAGRWREGRFVDHEFLKGAERQAPADHGKPYELSNHPVVGITWYEALAYAAWAEEQLQSAGRLPTGWQIRLPSEAEWEKAARGGIQVPREAERAKLVSSGSGSLAARGAGPLEDQLAALAKRRYLWGEDPDPDRANYAETKVGSTSAVGCFPGGASVYGCLDMSGNVWEWTRSEWGDYPYPRPGKKRNEREDLAGGDDRLPVLRGGSFDLNREGARCAARLQNLPFYRLRLFGFRLAASPFHSDA